MHALDAGKRLKTTYRPRWDVCLDGVRDTHEIGDDDSAELPELVMDALVFATRDPEVIAHAIGERGVCQFCGARNERGGRLTLELDVDHPAFLGIRAEKLLEQPPCEGGDLGAHAVRQRKWLARSFSGSGGSEQEGDT